MKPFFGALALLLTITANAQSRLLGTITDDRSTPIAGASIHLLNTEITVISDSAGGFTIRRLTGGRYTLQLSAIGFATLAANIDIVPGDNRQIFRLASS